MLQEDEREKERRKEKRRRSPEGGGGEGTEDIILIVLQLPESWSPALQIAWSFKRRLNVFLKT